MIFMMVYSKYDQTLYGYCMILCDLVVIPIMSRLCWFHYSPTKMGENDQPSAKGMEFQFSELIPKGGIRSQ